MPDSKISALPAATTPVAGTEILPIVQGSATKQVSIANLTVGRTVAMNNATVGSGGTTNFATSIILNGTNNAANGSYIQSQRNSSAAWFIGDYQSAFGSGSGYVTFTYGSVPTVFYNNVVGEQLRLDGVDVKATLGNFVQGTAAKGINFTANTPAAGMTSQLLNWYEEGTWTPNQGAGLTLVGAFSSSGTYTRIGRQVTVRGQVAGATSVAVAAAGTISSNLPFTAAVSHAGSMFNAAVNASGVVQITSASVVAADAIAATANITFTATYTV